MKLKIINTGLTAYSEALKIQEEAHASVFSGGADTLILCEHPHVFTLGKSADKSNILIDKNILSTINAEIYQTERGGDVTYHGPGQLVGYPIINLRKYGIGVKKYVDTLESSIIKTLSNFG
ncbi:lipoate--protein ligase, partial [Bacteroidia bacterium]|nr:lipoate--protein ligase [Bacteroidia bacterium]